MVNLRNLRVTAQRRGVSKSRSQAWKQSLRHNLQQPPPQAPSNIPTHSVAEPVTPTPAISVEADRPNAVAASTPIPATPQNLTASAWAQVPPAPANPLGRAGWSGFSDQPGQFSSKYCNEVCQMVGGDSSLFYFSHQLPSVKSIDQFIVMAPQEKPNITPKNRCTYC